MGKEIGLVKPASLRSQVESALRDAIIGGRLLPGERLVERDLCQSLGVSRSSLREALRCLEAEKLIHIIPHRGPVVASISRTEAAELYAVRRLLEGFVVKQFTQLASDEAIAELETAVAAMRTETQAARRVGVLRAKMRIYEILLAHGGNALVKDILTGLHSRIRLLRATSLTQPDRLAASLAEIDELVELIKTRQVEHAERAAKAHVANAEKAALRIIDAIDRPSD